MKLSEICGYFTKLSDTSDICESFIGAYYSNLKLNSQKRKKNDLCVCNIIMEQRVENRQREMIIIIIKHRHRQNKHGHNISLG